MPYRMLVEQNHLDRASISLMISPRRDTTYTGEVAAALLGKGSGSRDGAGWQGPTGAIGPCQVSAASVVICGPNAGR